MGEDIPRVKYKNNIFSWKTDIIPPCEKHGPRTVGISISQQFVRNAEVHLRATESDSSFKWISNDFSMWKFEKHCFRGGVSKLWTVGQIWLVFVSKDLLKQSHVHLFTYCLWPISCYSRRDEWISVTKTKDLLPTSLKSSLSDPLQNKFINLGTRVHGMLKSLPTIVYNM